MRKLCRLFLLLFVVVGLLSLKSEAVSAENQSRLVLAFYYAWYDPGSFAAGKTPYTPPAPYYSSDSNTIQTHVNQAKAAGIDGFVQSWYGPNPAQQTEPNFAALLNIAAAVGFTAAVDFETGSPYFANNQDRLSALNTLIATHAQHPAYLRVDGKPVIFFWANSLLSVDDWRAIRNAADPNHTTTWIAEGANTNYLAVFDGLNLYNTAWSDNPAGTAATWSANTRAAAVTYGAYKSWVATAMPGWDDTLLNRAGSFRRDRGNGAYYQSSFAGAAASNPDWLIISTFNEWAEGSNIEPSNEFGAFYLDQTAQLIAAYKTGNIAPPPPVATPGPTLTPAPSKTPGPSPTPAPTKTPLPPPTAAPSPTPDNTGAIVYRVQPGDTLFWIAYRFGVPLDTLYQLNGFSPATGALLSIDQPVILGYAADRAIGAAQAIPGAAISQPADKAPVSPTALPGVGTLFPSQFSRAQLREDGAFVHVVQAGDSLIGIAVTYGLTMEQIYAASGLGPQSVLQIGQVVILGRLPEPAEQGGSTDLPAPPPPTATPTPSPTPTPAPTFTRRPTNTLPAAPATPVAQSSGRWEEKSAESPSSPSPAGQESLLPVFMSLFGSLVVMGGLLWYISRTTRNNRP